MSSWPWLLAPCSVEPKRVRRVVVFGLGRIGRKVARELATAGKYEVVGALDHSSALVGRRLSELLALDSVLETVVASPSTFDWLGARADAMVYAAADDLRIAEPHILTAVESGAHVVGFTVGLVFAWRRFPDVAERLDAAARAHAVAVFGTGVNPGYVSDVLVLGLASVCRDVTRVELLRVNDLSDQSPPQLDARGIGESEDEFRRRLAEGALKVHTGFEESVGLLGRGLGWEVDRVGREVKPILASSSITLADRTIEPGRVAGLDNIARAWSHGRLRIRMRHVHVASPVRLGYRPQDRLRIRARPPVVVTIKPEISGADATAAIAFNVLSYIASAPHGLLVTGWPAGLSHSPVARAKGEAG